jgi:hypothetical protein
MRAFEAHYLYVLKLKAPAQWGKVGARCHREGQCGTMCSTYPICTAVSNESSSEQGASNSSHDGIPSIFDLDVADTNWVITSSFIIFTMQTGKGKVKVKFAQGRSAQGVGGET